MSDKVYLSQEMSDEGGYIEAAFSTKELTIGYNRLYGTPEHGVAEFEIDKYAEAVKKKHRSITIVFKQDGTVIGHDIANRLFPDNISIRKSTSIFIKNYMETIEKEDLVMLVRVTTVNVEKAIVIANRLRMRHVLEHSWKETKFK